MKAGADLSDTPQRITSLQNDQVKALVRLRNRRERDETQLLLIEEPLVIARAMAAEYPLAKLYICPELVPDEDQDLLHTLKTVVEEIVEVPPAVMNKISYRESSTGLIVVATQRHQSLSELKVDASSPALFVILEGVEKPGNLGAVLRVADGAGANAVIICGKGADVFNPNVLRASRGANFAMPTVQCSHEELLIFLAAENIQTVATSPAADGAWDQVDLTGSVAIFLGTEHDGLSDELLHKATARISLPMLGVGDSLNVATTAAILLFEAVRQRRANH
ncbi:MAG: TrmH family RNA methyltransferase [Candidatus Krumholzibacteriia bacterium]